MRKDGSVLPVEICSRAIELDGQKAFFSVIRNVSERKRAELKSLASEEKWRLLFENMTTGLALHEVVCDEQGRAVDYRFLEINPAYEQLTGLKASNIIGPYCPRSAARHRSLLDRNLWPCRIVRRADFI